MRIGISDLTELRNTISFSEKFRRKITRSGILGEVRKHRRFISRRKGGDLSGKKVIRRFKQNRRKYYYKITLEEGDL